MKANTAQLEPEPTYQKGFKQAEERPVVGAKCVRAWDPHQESGRWGRSYEHWRFPGKAMSRDLVEQLRGVEQGKASRLDIRFDVFGVKLDPLEIRERVKALFPKRSTDVHLSDHGGTVYLGAPSSDKRVVVYDKEAEFILAEGYDPEKIRMSESWWRVELRLHDEAAAALWEVIVRQGLEFGIQVAAGMIRDFSGITLGVECAMAPDRAPRASEFEESLFACMKQYGPTLKAAIAAGVDVEQLAQAATASSGSRTSRWRQEQKIKAAISAGGESITRAVTALLRRGGRVGVLPAPGCPGAA